MIFDDETPHRLLKAIRPDVLVKGGTTGDIVGREVVEAYGGRTHQAISGDVSTSDIVELTVVSSHTGRSDTTYQGSTAMKRTDCECTQEGWCERHQAFKGRGMFLLCQQKHSGSLNAGNVVGTRASGIETLSQTSDSQGPMHPPDIDPIDEVPCELCGPAEDGSGVCVSQAHGNAR